jgi:trehalose 6-phosphate phosphatase
MKTNIARRLMLRASQLPGPDELGAIALLLDIDGTILDTAITPSSVVVPGSLRESLAALLAKTGGALAVVSGRSISNVDALFAPLRLPAIGAHGAEMRLASEDLVQTRHPAAIGAHLRDLIAAAAASDPRILLEDKGSSFAVHYRLVPQLERTLKAEIAAIIARFGFRDLEVLHGKAVIEIKPASFSKGEAVCELMKYPPFAHRKPVFVGDDTTDESVFEILPSLRGLGYSVERLFSGASGAFSSPHEVRLWRARLSGAEGTSGQ